MLNSMVGFFFFYFVSFKLFHSYQNKAPAYWTYYCANSNYF